MFKIIPIKNIIPSKGNYRKSFNQAALDELTASVKAKGVLQPILVRPLKGKKYEIVAGHRRHQAALSAGLKDLPAMIKELSDEEALEVQVIENSQREDPNPIDEALGFKRLLEMGKHTPETLAGKIDHSVGYVLSRVRLADLDDKVQDAIASGEVGLGHALLFTRLKNTGDQKNFLKEVIEQEMSVREAKDAIKEFYALELRHAPFDIAGCAACPAKSGNQTDLFPEIKQKDECTDRSCYHTKSKQFYKQYLKEKAAQGFKTFSDKKTATDRLYGKGSTEIYPPGSDSWKTIPKKYKTECMQCAEHHAFFAYEVEEYGGGKSFRSGEICLDNKCLTAMQKAGKKEKGASPDSAPESKSNPHTIRIKAKDCRDRFLLKALLPKIGISLALKQRLAIHHIVSHLSRVSVSWRDAFIKGYNPQYKGAGLYNSGDKVYRGIAGIPAEKLDKALLHLVIETFSMTDRGVMLQMTPEAGIDMARDFQMDEEFLKGKTKDELAALIKELWPTKEERPLEWAVDMDKWCAGSPKGKIIDRILGMNLTGKVPAAVADVCRLDGDREDEEGEAEMSCIGCGCTEAEACPGGCHWLAKNESENEGVCSECAEEIEGIRGLEGWVIIGENAAPEASEAAEKAKDEEDICNGCGELSGECLCGNPLDPADEPDTREDPTMPAPTETKSKRKSKARA